MADIRDELFRTAVQDAGNWLADPSTVILDTETTDLAGYICEIAIIDTAGNVLMEGPVNPLAPISPQASRIHGHTAESLAESPRFSTIAPQLLDTLAGRRVVIYNSYFDMNILRNELRRWYLDLWGDRRLGVSVNFAAERELWANRRTNEVINRSTWCCAMLAYADFVGDWNNYHGNNRWQRLPGGDHSALGDCRATLAVLRKMAAAAEVEAE